MKLRFHKISLLTTILIGHFYSSVAFADEFTSQGVDTSAQIIAEKIISTPNTSKIYCTNNLRCSSSLTSSFYSSRQYVPIWSDAAGNISSDASAVIEILHHAYNDGLNPYDYHTKELATLISQMEANKAAGGVPADLRADFDLTLTDAYLLYSSNLQIGRVDTSKVYPDWPIDRKYVNVLTQLQAASRDNKLVSNLTDITPQNSEYIKLKNKLALYLHAGSNGGWKTIPTGASLVVGAHGERVRLLIERLKATGEYQLTDTTNVYTESVKKAVMQFQRNVGLKASGIVDSATLQELNVPTMQRVKQIALNMDRLRWLPSQLGLNYVWVNIPSYSLSLYRNGKLDLTMPVIVGGKGENKTCVVNSSIATIETNPSWGVPRRIATKEYLSKIQESSTYLARHGMRLYDNATGSEVDPTTVDWSAVNQKNFNYFIKQDPGRQNALGKVKFIFNNKCGIYLHDTSNPRLFAKMSRSLSHGCIRVGEPLALANDLVANNSVSWSVQKLNDTIKAGTHTWVKLNNPMSIHIVYQTALVDSGDNLVFRKDIYGIDNINYPVFMPLKKPVAESSVSL